MASRSASLRYGKAGSTRKRRDRAHVLRHPHHSTAYATTGIPNIEVYIPVSPAMVAWARRANRFKWLLGTGMVQNFMKRRIAKTKGPSAAKRDARPTFVWGEATNARGDKRTAWHHNGQRLQPDGDRNALAVVFPGEVQSSLLSLRLPRDLESGST